MKKDEDSDTAAEAIALDAATDGPRCLCGEYRSCPTPYSCSQIRRSQSCSCEACVKRRSKAP